MCALCGVVGLEERGAPSLRSAAVSPPSAVIDPIRELPEGEGAVVPAAETGGYRRIGNTQGDQNHERDHDHTPSSGRPALSGSITADWQSPDGVVESSDSAHCRQAKPPCPQSPSQWHCLSRPRKRAASSVDTWVSRSARRPAPADADFDQVQSRSVGPCKSTMLRVMAPAAMATAATASTHHTPRPTSSAVPPSTTSASNAPTPETQPSE